MGKVKWKRNLKDWNKKERSLQRMLADYHIHSRYSDDSEEEMEIIVLSAIEKGFDEICFTDHVDYGVKI